MDCTGDSSKPLRWGIVGSGFICSDFCLALRTFSPQEHKIVAVGARSLESAQEFASLHGVEKAYGSYESIASDPDLDIVYIGTINSTHVPLSLMMLEAGKHVLCEKSMALCSAGVKKVTEFAQQKNKLFLEGFWTRFFPVYKQLQTELTNGSIGSVRGVTGYFGVNFDWEKQERIADKKLGGGIMLDIGCYLVQLACLVFNHEKPERIFAHGSLHHTGVDKSLSILLGYKDGRTAQLVARGDTSLANNVLIYGTNGNLEISPNFWCSTQLKTPTEVFNYTLPDTAAPTHFENSAGFVYEIEAVRKTLLKGETQVQEITHANSLLIAEIIEEVLRQVGVSYDSL